MNLLDLFSLQGTLFALMIVGAILKKKEIIDANGKKCLTDLCINVVIPCNIFKSCLIEFWAWLMIIVLAFGISSPDSIIVVAIKTS